MNKATLLFSLLFILAFSVSAQKKQMTWTVPDTWVDTKKSSTMRITTLAVKDNQALIISVTKFPGNVGGELANVNRWRRQLGLPTIKAADLAKSLEVIESKAGKAKLLNITNNGQQMLALMMPFDGATYFFKMTGKEEEVKKQKDAMVKLAKTFK